MNPSLFVLCPHYRRSAHAGDVCKHGKTHMHTASEWACAGPDPWCPGGRPATLEDLGLAELRQLVDEQAEDEGLWFIASTAPEAYLQQELRRRKFEVAQMVAGESL
jgi:hypothetical protein